MRKFILIFVPLGVLIGLFFVYQHYQPHLPSVGHGTDNSTAPPVDVGGVSGSGLQSGGGVWCQQFDRQTGRLAYQFKADFYQNEPGGAVRVTRPVAEFFLNSGQILRVEGTDGVVHLPPSVDSSAMGSGPTEPPRYGSLQNVVVHFYANSERKLQGKDDMTIHLANARFDNDTYRLATYESLDPQGHVVKEDRVPVELRATDYTFDGTGLVMYWNDPDERLKSLDIAHVTKLRILHPGSFTGTTASGTAGNAPTPAPAANPPVAVTPAPVVAAAVATADTVRLCYTATFNKDVEITQSGQDLADGDLLKVIFCPKQDSQTAGAAVVSTPAAMPAPATPLTPPPVAVKPDATATEKSEPVDVYCTGPLHIEPTDGKIPPGEAEIHLTGAPVKLHHADPNGKPFDGWCAELIYRTADATVKMLSSADTQLKLSQQRPDGTDDATVSGQTLTYARRDNTATMDGAGEAVFADPNDPKSIMHATWQKNAVLKLASDARNQTTIRSAELVGNVKVAHPRFDLAAGNDLQLDFDPESGENALREVTADGDTVCVVHEANAADRSIKAQHLKVLTDRDKQQKLYARTVYADGGVDAGQDKQSLSCENLVVTLRPVENTAAGATAPASASSGTSAMDRQTGNVELEHLTAKQAVTLKGENGSKAMGDELQVDRVNEHMMAVITGAPATVGDNDSTMTGAKISISGENKIAKIDGPGVLNAKPASTDGKTPSAPVMVQWATSAVFDGNADLITVLGDVTAESTAANGTKDVAHAPKMLLTLQDAPVPTPATTTMTSTVTTTAVATANAGTGVPDDFSFMRNKTVRTVSLVESGTDKPWVDSTLLDAQGAVLQREHVWAERIDDDSVAQKLTIPGPGRMLAEQHGPAATEPATPANTGPMGARGQTTFQWEKELVYDQKGRVAHLEGSVVILHRDDGPKPHRMRLDADQVDAEFAPSQGTPSQETSASATTGPTPNVQASVQVRKLTASATTPGGTVRVVSDDKLIHCSFAEYDPQTQLLTCRGDDQTPVNVTDPSHPVGTEFDEVVLNVGTNTLVQMKNLTVRGHP